MYLRGTRVHVAPDKINDAIKFFESNTLPAVRKAPGNVGAVLLVNRQTGDGIGITYWDSPKSLAASEQVGIDARTGTIKNVPTTQVINVERSEVLLMERAAPPKAGTFTRYTHAAGDIGKIDAGVNVARSKVLPALKSQKGFRAFIVSVDRQTGRNHAASTWDTMADLEASEKVIAPLRREAGDAAGFIPETVKVEIFESVVADIAAQVVAASGARAN